MVTKQELSSKCAKGLGESLTKGSIPPLVFHSTCPFPPTFGCGWILPSPSSATELKYFRFNLNV